MANLSFLFNVRCFTVQGKRKEWLAEEAKCSKFVDKFRTDASENHKILP